MKYSKKTLARHVHSIEASAKRAERDAMTWAKEGENDMVKMFRADARRLRTVGRAVAKGDIRRAERLLTYTDTACRDMISQTTFNFIYR